jgi:hypothetical protein
MTKLKRIVRFLIALTAILLLIATVFSWRSHAQLESWIEERREAGEPVTVADLEPKDLDPAANAATYLVRVSGDADKLWRELEPIAYADDFSWRTGLSEEQNQQAVEAIDAYPEVFAAIERAVTLSRYSWPRDYTVAPDKFMENMLESVNSKRLFARIQIAQARQLKSIGEADEAAKVGLQMLQLARLQDQEPTLVHYLVNQACRAMAVNVLNGVLQTGKLEPATHAAVDAELAKHDSMECLIHAMVTERAFGMEKFRSWKGQLLFGLSGSRSSYLQVMDDQIAKGTKSHYELADNASKPPAAKGVARTIAPALVASREAMNRTRALLRCLRVLNAIQAKGVTDENVDIGKLGLPKLATIDPYTGTALSMKATPEGWLVYSVGQDRADGGGTLADMSDVGVGPPESTE